MKRKEIRAPRGPELNCKSWQQEAILRMLMNNLDPEVARDWENLIVYGGTGKAARNWDCFDKIVETLKILKNDETLLMQSGKPVGVFKTNENSPRALITNSLLVPKWATQEEFRRLEQLELTCYGQMTAGSWIYIGTQGILQGTYETLAALAQIHFNSSLKGKFVLTGGLGEMGGAQPLAVTMNEGANITVEVDEKQIYRRIKDRYCEIIMKDLDEALKLIDEAKRKGNPISIGLLGNTAEILPEILKKGIIPDIVTDQTSAHDPLNGYIPIGLSLEEASTLRKSNPEEYLKKAGESIAIHAKAMLEFQKRGSIVFDYGNNLRGEAEKAGVNIRQKPERLYPNGRFKYPGFVPSYVRPLFCEGKGPFRWVALSGEKEDIYKTDDAMSYEFSDNKPLIKWLKLAKERVAFQGLPARICWLGYGERAKFGKIINEMVRSNDLTGPIVIGRDHLDGGSVASPNRETEEMMDGSDAIADWPILNALLNSICGATWVSVHHGGGVGIGNSIHAGMVVVADGTKEADKRLERVLTADPFSAIIRHVDAGYEIAKEVARKNDINIPMLDKN